ncbi:MAG TPA: GNAT family N-acetyltransferase [Rhodanobacteraceae bacterium]|jgi:predicted GNAT superfamily acetyltransferase|nr:GNAT family N-acetyltransferase [Rhodanobacteraceae bacterium]
MIRNATPDDFPAILALNAESVHFLSPLNPDRLLNLHAQAAYHRVVEHDGKAAAFLLALREGADYDSPNYRWFAQQYPRFLYIDRIVVAGAVRGLGFGAHLYDDILAFAATTDAARLTAEFDVEPPNPVSAAFHQRYRFREVGTQWIGGGKKQVSLQARELGD